MCSSENSATSTPAKAGGAYLKASETPSVGIL